MLRLTFVFIIASVGLYFALQGGAYYALLFYLWNAYFRPEDWVWSNFIRHLDFSFYAGVYLVMLTLFSGKRLFLNGHIFLIFLFLIHTLLATIFSEHFDYSWKYWMDFLKSTIITYTIILLVDDFYKFRLALIVIVFSLGLEPAKQGWYYLFVSPEWANPNKIAFLGDNNLVSVGMLMLAPIIMLLARITQQKWAKWIYWTLLIGVFYRALSTHSRGGFLSCLGLGLSHLLYSRQKFRVLFGGGLIVLMLLPALPDIYWDRMQTILTYEEENEKSAINRLHYWAVAIEMGKANPFLGVGYSAFNMSYDTYDFAFGAYLTGRSVHNSILGVLAELGYVGAALFSLIIFNAFRNCYYVYKRTKNSFLFHSELSHSAIALSTSFVVFLIGGSFVIFQYNEMLWHYIGLTIVLKKLTDQYIEESSRNQISQSSSNSNFTAARTI